MTFISRWFEVEPWEEGYDPRFPVRSVWTGEPWPSWMQAIYRTIYMECPELTPDQIAFEVDEALWTKTLETRGTHADPDEVGSPVP